MELEKSDRLLAEPSFDVVIVGAAAVGLACALALRDAGLRVALCDRAGLRVAPANATWDARVYAISPGSAAFLHRVGAWQRLPEERLQAIESMRVVGDAGGAINFSAYELGERALAWIVENRALQGALIEVAQCAAGAGDGLSLVAPVEPDSLVVARESVRIGLSDGSALDARLLIGADGAQSWVRQQAGLLAEPVAYGHSGVVANFEVERAHEGRAWQWFLADEGVLAWLPLPGRRVSMVWSLADEKAARLLAATPEELALRVADAGGRVLGAMRCITAAKAFPLRYLRMPTCTSARVALIGDAAHCVHPLAGQGLNLGLGDADALARVLATRGRVSDCGTRVHLERFARERAEPVWAMQQVTDGLSRLFRAHDPVSVFTRNQGLAAADRLGVVKRLLAQPALR